MTTILVTIERKHYIVTEHDVELLGASHFNSDVLTRRSDGQYLRILIAAMKAKFGNGHGAGRRRKLTEADAQEQGAFLAETHTRFYAAVLKGVTTPDCEADERLSVDEQRARAAQRNARGGFARSAASTLQAFIRAGGDIRAVKLDTVTKGELRAFARSVTRPEENERARAAHASVQRLTRDIEALAEDDPDAARLAVDEAMAALEAIVARMVREGHKVLAPVVVAAPEAHPTATQVFRTKTRARFAARKAA